MPSSIVIGAGAAGLTAALTLQRNGHDVLLLEAAEHVGGCASAFQARDFRFLAGATTLIGLEPEMPLGRVLRELDIDFTAPAATRNLGIVHRGQRVVITTDRAANHAALAARYGAAFADFWREASTLGARGWQLITELSFPPRRPADLLDAALNPRAWTMVPALTRSTASQLPADVGPEARTLLDELLLISTQARAPAVPYLFGALGLEYLERPLYLPDGGLASLLEKLAAVFVERGGTLKTKTPALRIEPGYRVHVDGERFTADNVVLNLTHWDSQRLLSDELQPAFAGTVKRQPDAWAACTTYLGIRDVFGDDAPAYHQILLDHPMPITGAESVFVTLSRPDDRTMAPPGFRSVTMSCHTPARGWDELSEAEHGERKARLTELFTDALAQAFPAVRGAETPVRSSATPRTWQGFTRRWGGRVGGLPFDFDSLLRGYPTGRSKFPGLVRVGDTVFPGQSVPACAWGARRVVHELITETR